MPLKYAQCHHRTTTHFSPPHTRFTTVHACMVWVCQPSSPAPCPWTLHIGRSAPQLQRPTNCMFARQQGHGNVRNADMSGAARACQPQARQTTPTLLRSLAGLSPSWPAAPRLCAIVARVCHAAGQCGRGSRVRRGQVHLPVLVPHAPREVPVAAGGSTLKTTSNLSSQLLYLPLIHCMNTLLR